MRAFLAILLVLLCVGPLSCRPGEVQTPSGRVVEPGAALAFSSAVVALELLDDIEVRRMQAWVEPPTAAMLADAELRVRRLELARDALDLFAAALDRGELVRTELAEAVRLLREAATACGAALPPKASAAIAAAEAWLGGDS